MDQDWRDFINAKNRKSPAIDRTKDIWGRRTPYFGEWPVREDEQSVDETGKDNGQEEEHEAGSSS